MHGIKSSSNRLIQLHSMLDSWDAGSQPRGSWKEDAHMPDTKSEVQISFRAPFELKVAFEQALLYRSIREGRKIAANKVLIEQVEAFIEREEKLRQQ